jgi:hypothetical protein
MITIRETQDGAEKKNQLYFEALGSGGTIGRCALTIEEDTAWLEVADCADEAVLGGLVRAALAAAERRGAKAYACRSMPDAQKKRLSKLGLAGPGELLALFSRPCPGCRAVDKKEPSEYD